MRDDLIVAGHDCVLSSHPIGFAGVYIGDIDVFTVSRVLRSHNSTIETNLDAIIGLV